MNIILIGFSTTGKSTFLKEIEKEVGDEIKLIDSDSEISEEYDNHIYQLFLKNHNDKDPVNRKEIMDKITQKENLFIRYLQEIPNPYISALGPNVHTRRNWKDYYETVKPFTIFFKGDLETVYEGLIRREDQLSEISSDPAFGNWNLGVIREYNYNTKKYQRMPKNKAMESIKNLLKVNEDYYTTVANLTVGATQLFKWHKNYDVDKVKELIEIVKTNIG